jgi:hypothetical protein
MSLQKLLDGNLKETKLILELGLLDGDLKDIGIYHIIVQ